MKKPYFGVIETYPRDEVDSRIAWLEARIQDLEWQVEDLKNEVLEANERNE